MLTEKEGRPQRARPLAGAAPQSTEGRRPEECDGKPANQAGNPKGFRAAFAWLASYDTGTKTGLVNGLFGGLFRAAAGGQPAADSGATPTPNESVI